MKKAGEKMQAFVRQCIQWNPEFLVSPYILMINDILPAFLNNVLQ